MTDMTYVVQTEHVFDTQCRELQESESQFGEV